ncbi:hypothetical protein V6N13_010918 [Hibiscus sabdariffa]
MRSLREAGPVTCGLSFKAFHEASNHDYIYREVSMKNIGIGPALFEESGQNRLYAEATKNIKLALQKELSAVVVETARVLQSNKDGNQATTSALVMILVFGTMKPLCFVVFFDGSFS